MVCKLFYSSEYLKDCDISQFGEGCESCVPVFQSSLIIPVIFIFCIVVFFILIKHFENRFTNEMKGGFRK